MSKCYVKSIEADVGGAGVFCGEAVAPCGKTVAPCCGEASCDGADNTGGDENL